MAFDAMFLMQCAEASQVGEDDLQLLQVWKHSNENLKRRNYRQVRKHSDWDLERRNYGQVRKHSDKILEGGNYRQVRNNLNRT